MKPYNLLVEPWIPVRRRSGECSWIAPWQVTEVEDPPLSIDTGRPDFDGALIQFLIGLVQTAAAPESKKEWRDRFDHPPNGEILRKQFGRFSSAFDLDGDGPRFMQDHELKPADANEFPIASLLIESPGEKTIEDNTDLFVKRAGVRSLGLPMAAAALFSLQTNAPSGGAGYRTSLRGGGPLSTVVLAETLWRTIWLNVLQGDEMLQGPGNADLKALSDSFPWMGPTRTSEKGKRPTTPEDVHPLQHFWGMPRRIRLRFEESGGQCDVSCLPSKRLVAKFFATNYGTNYEGAWRHPLTPYSRKKADDIPLPRKGQPDGIPYRDWPILTMGSAGNEPARVVHAWANDKRSEMQKDHRLWVFGFDMDNMKARCWHSATTPLLAGDLDGERRERFVAAAQQFVAASEDVRKTLVGHVKAALFRRPKDRKGDSFAYVSRTFWAATESDFFGAIRRMHEALTENKDDTPIREEWLGMVQCAALRIFEENSQEAGDFAATDIKRVSTAWNDLRRFTSPRGKKLRGVIGLPPLPNEKLNEEQSEVSNG